MKNKKGLNEVIVILVIVVLSLAAAFLLYYNLRNITDEQFGDEVSCFDNFAITQSVFIKEACYLNSGEIVVEVERKSDALSLIDLRFVFFGDNSTKWKIVEKKCSDVRTLSTKYGGYCSIPNQDSEINYVFNVSDLEKKNQVKLVITEFSDSEELSCLVDTRTIKERC
ncbi:MAG: hypothetical protein PHC28_01310 [Flavobacterium sp.]|uniref:hypothetical protein n=1 Tax=Flavobacterium sp. TaxID=239 RepID=UPI00260F3CB3|nr:hypothetical protein [Flavobacterium sp.]MDD5149106.1 hypothetical protein [Flavobacterium sp.]